MWRERYALVAARACAHICPQQTRSAHGERPTRSSAFASATERFEPPQGVQRQWLSVEQKRMLAASLAASEGASPEAPHHSVMVSLPGPGHYDSHRVEWTKSKRSAHRRPVDPAVASSGAHQASDVQAQSATGTSHLDATSLAINSKGMYLCLWCCYTR